MGEFLDEEALQEEQRVSRRRKIAELFENGIDLENPGETVAVHATSLEAVEQIIETGMLPTGKGSGAEGNIYFYRLDVSIPQEYLLNNTQLEEVQEGLGSYGRILGFEKNLAKKLNLDFVNDGIFLTRLYSSVEAIFYSKLYRGEFKAKGLADITNEQIRESASKITLDDLIKDYPAYEKEFRQYANQCGIENIIQAISEAFQRRGVVLGFSSKILELGPESAYEESDEGWRVKVPNGLSLDYLSGIEPLGDVEYNYLEQIQESESK